MIIKNKRILFIGAHMDDLELGCGGTIDRLSADNKIKILVLSKNVVDSTGVVKEERDLGELEKAMTILGISKSDVSVGDISGQLFPEERQSILELMYEIKTKFEPEIIFVPAIEDVHQDHYTTGKTALKAFKRETVLGYEIINSSFGYTPNFWIWLDKKNIDKKVSAVTCYKSQKTLDATTGDYFSKEIIESMARMRGAKIGYKFAESFSIYSMVLTKRRERYAKCKV